MRLPKDLLSGIYTKPRIFLCEVDKERICQLETTNTSATLKFNSYSELSCEVGRVYNNLVTGETLVNPHYDKIEALRLIEIENFGYFEIQGPELVSDGIKEAKSLNAYSLEYTLSQKYLTDFIVNTGAIGSIEVTYAEEVTGDINNIQPITLYNPSNPSLSLLHLAIKEVYGWKIGYVDVSLQTLRRSFEIDRESVYDFLTNEVCKKFNCYIVFDTIDNTINVYAESLTAKFIGDDQTRSFTISPPFDQIGTVSVGGYKTTRWQYNKSTGVISLEDVPSAGSHIEVVDGALSEWETDVFVSFDNLSQEININYEADEIKTKLTVTYGEDDDIREVNLGMPYLTDISYYYTVEWMGQDLYDAYTKYMQKSNASQVEYANNSQEILTINDKIYYEQTRLSLEYSLAQGVNSTTVGTYYVRQENLDGSFYYKEVSLPSEYDANETYYSNVTANVTEEKMSDLYKVLQKYFNNENTDNNSGDQIITSWKTDLYKLQDDFKFMTIYTLDYLSSELSKVGSSRIGNNTAELAINNFLAEVWYELGRTPLQEIYLKQYKLIKETNMQAGWSNKADKNYPYYYPVILYIDSIESAIADRDSTIKQYEEDQSVFYTNNANIRDSLIMDKNFTEQQLIRLSAFLREDELHIEDVVETSQDDLSSSFKIKQDAMESGRIELQKLCQPQLQFSMTMANIYALQEFEPIIDQFQLGNVIKVSLRSDYIKQSRLMQVNINFDDFSDFSCEFGELTSLRSQSDIHADLLKNAITAGKSVATNSSYWSRGSDAATSIDLKIQQGLLDATTQIKAMNGNQGVVIDQYGIHLRDVNPDTGAVDPKQGWIVNNQFLYSDDGFKSTKAVFGEYTYNDETYYGILADALVGRLLIGSQIKLENNNSTMSFDYSGLSVTNGINSFNLNPNATNLLKISNSTQDIFYVDSSGNLNMTGILTAKAGGTIGGWNIGDTELSCTTNDSNGNALYNVRITNSGKSTETLADGTIRATNVLACTDFSKPETDTNRWPFYLLKDGTMKCTKANIVGHLEASTGKIGMWQIGSNGSLIGTHDGKTTGMEPPNVGMHAIAVGSSNQNDWGDAPFRVLHDGTLYATEAHIEGEVTAKNGTIADYTIDGAKLVGTDVGMCSLASQGWAFWAGSYTGSSAPFRVGHNGILWAEGAQIEGTINCTGDTGDVRLESGHVNFYYDNKYTGQIGQIASPRTISISGCNLYCEQGIYLPYKKFLTCYDYDTHLIGMNSDTDIIIGWNNSNMNSHNIKFYNKQTLAGYFGTQGLYFTGARGINLNDKYAFRYYNSAVYVGADTEPLKLVGTSVTANGTSVSSDERKKNNITMLDDKYLKLIDVLSAKTYKFNEYRTGTTNCGFIAQELLSAISDVGLKQDDFGAFVDVYGDGREYAIDYTQFIPIMWEEIKSLRKRISELENNE